ncbi:putative RNA-directed DNA polymerase from transposon X-element [Portunus trituberculatus]|uniref:Putative RNA-directed DNA polymerase from transposon X-element n=1 Tax=Portunus trituberculatus TaxID=210409 RepID=A0A5B7I1S3_PORTR|nr:putative RNA-directed DNA polymerase from transposon X-element [Portunus trituberculatus]
MVHRLRGCQWERFEYLLVDGVRISDPAQIANIFKTHWQDIFHPHPLPAHGPSVAHINITTHVQQHLENTLPHNTTQLTRLDPHHYLTTPFEEEDVPKMLRYTSKRAPGPTGITWPMIKNLPPEIITNITKIFNASLSSGYFPKPLKISNITLIPKPGKDLHLPENYRPISLLEILGKTFEQLINQRLRTHLESNEMLAPQQFGFRSNASTKDALNSIITYLHANSLYFRSALVTKDVEKAFDTVWRTGLKYENLQ